MSYSLLHTAYVAAASRERLEGHDGRPRPKPPPGRLRRAMAGALARAADRLDPTTAHEAIGAQRPEPAPALVLVSVARGAGAARCEGRRRAGRQPAGATGRQGRQGRRR